MTQPFAALLRDRPMTAYQFAVVGLCVLINMIDGYDILALSFTAPVIVREWGLSPEQTGLVFSANLAGIGIGALVFSFAADLVGRRPVILFGTLLMSIGMISTATIDGVWGLASCRVVTGLGIGAMVATAGTLAIEYSSSRWRTVSVALVVVGFPIGGTLGGFVTAWLMTQYGWRPIFLFGGSLTVLLLPLLLWRLPESIEYLLERQPRDALARANKYAARLGLPRIQTLPPPGARVAGAGQFLELWRPPHRRASLMLCALYPLFMFTFYFFVNWSTKLATERGLADIDAIRMSSLISLSGIAGGIAFGLIASRLPLRRVVAMLSVVMAAGIASFGVLPPTTAVMNLAAIAVGFCMWGASATIYSAIALSYPARVRASGIGLVVTVGRAGSALGPWAAGMLRGAGVEWPAVALVLALPAVLAALLVTLLRADAR